jgi:type I restriction enzyme S subunit
MKISYADYIKKTDVSVLVAEVIFSELENKYPIKFISEVADTTSGGTPSRGNVEYYNGEIPWLKSGELKDGIIEKAEEYITQKGLANSSAKLHPKNTLLLAMYGATAGRIGIAKMEVSTNQAVCALFPKENVTREYLFWFLRQYRYKFIEISKGGAQPNISQSVINETKIPVPDIELQKKISDILTKIEKEGFLDISIIPKEFKGKVNNVFTSKNNVFKIDSELALQLSLVKKLRQQLLQDAVQGKLVEQDPNDEPAFELLKKIKTQKKLLIKEKKLKKEKELSPIKVEEIPFEIPENWLWSRLGDICVKIGSGSTPNGSNYSLNGLPFFRSQNIYDESLVYEDVKFISQEVHKQMNGTTVYANDILLNITGGSMGRCALVPIDFNEGNVSQHVCIIRPIIIDNEFLHYIVLSPYFQKSIFSSTTGAGREGLPKYNLEQFLIPIPPLAEQHLIVLKLEQLLQNSNELEESIKQSTFVNEKLLHQVLRESIQNQ